MNEQNKHYLGILLAGLALIFVLLITLPRGWQKISRDASAVSLLEDYRATDRIYQQSLYDLENDSNLPGFLSTEVCQDPKTPQTPFEENNICPPSEMDIVPAFVDVPSIPRESATDVIPLDSTEAKYNLARTKADPASLPPTLTSTNIEAPLVASRSAQPELSPESIQTSAARKITTLVSSERSEFNQKLGIPSLAKSVVEPQVASSSASKVALPDNAQLPSAPKIQSRVAPSNRTEQPANTEDANQLAKLIPAKPLQAKIKTPDRHQVTEQVNEMTMRVPAHQEQTQPSGIKPQPSIWLTPTALLAKIRKLHQHPELTSWATSTEQSILEIVKTKNADQQLVKLKESLFTRKLPVNDRRAQSRWALAKHAIYRWSEIQEMAQQSLKSPEVFVHSTNVASTHTKAPVVEVVDVQQLQERITELAMRTQGDPQGETWRQYLLLSALQSALDANQPKLREQGASIAKIVLERLNEQYLSTPQQQFVASKPIAGLVAELQKWAAEDVKVAELVAFLNSYEQSPNQADATELARTTNTLLNASNPQAKAFGVRLEEHYRNHNVRIALHQSLLQRFFAKVESTEGPVRETIVGVPVFGNSVTKTTVNLELQPSKNQISLLLKADGEVESDTRAKSGPALAVTSGLSQFTATKPIILNQSGVKLSPAEVDVNSTNHLRGFSTDFDHIPFIGSVVHQYALSRHDELKPQAKCETEMKVSRKIQAELDTKLQEEVAKAEAKVVENFIQPLNGLGLNSHVYDFTTTEDRVSIRTRIATTEQLGSHTPRPKAFADSLISAQIHESALNNVIHQMDFAGKRINLEEFQTKIREKLGLNVEGDLDARAEQIVLTFAKQDPIRIQLANNQLKFTMNLDKMERKKSQATNISVEAVYQVTLGEANAVLSREDSLKVSLPNVAFRTGLVFRSVLNKMFSKNKSFALVPEKVFENPKLADLKVKSVDFQEGWLGISIVANPKEAVVATSTPQAETRVAADH